MAAKCSTWNASPHQISYWSVEKCLTKWSKRALLSLNLWPPARWSSQIVVYNGRRVYKNGRYESIWLKTSHITSSVTFLSCKIHGLPDAQMDNCPLAGGKNTTDKYQCMLSYGQKTNWCISVRLKTNIGFWPHNISEVQMCALNNNQVTTKEKILWRQIVTDKIEISSIYQCTKLGEIGI